MAGHSNNHACNNGAMISTTAVADENAADAYEIVCALLLLAAGEVDDSERVRHEARQIFRGHPVTRDPDLPVRLANEAEYHGVAALIEPMISATAADAAQVLPEDAQRAFVALASRHRRAACAREKCVDRLLEAFASEGIPIILLKGAALAHLIYPAPHLRPMVDIDVLIDAADLRRAVAIVCGLGCSFAPCHASRFAGHMHHLPAATTTSAGFPISLEIHLDAMAPDNSERLTFANLTTEPVRFRRGAGPRGLALGHIDMLRHLARHAFEPARRVRLMHLHDLWRYQKTFAAEIDWDKLRGCFPQVMVALRLVASFFARSRSTNGREKIPDGIGVGMAPLSEIAAMPLKAGLTALFNPSAWWLHAYYGIPPEKSLLLCRTVRHPVTLARWFARRLSAAIVPSRPFDPQ
jgi:hypothetical protein